VKGVRNTSFVPAEPIKQKINLNGVWYKKGVSGTIYKIIRIKADKEGNDDERKVFRLNAKAERDQNTTMLKGTTPGRNPLFFEEDNYLIDSSKEEYDQKYSPVEATPVEDRERRGAAWEICVGDTIQFYNRVRTRLYHGSGAKYRNMGVAGEVVMVTPFFFSLRDPNNPNNPYGKKYFYTACALFKVNLAIDTTFKNLVDGFFPNMDAKVKEERDFLVAVGNL
tara:strand:+ start:62 stop:730 length:669 start_codon:yes stop_codon:yes gene_type:complete